MASIEGQLSNDKMFSSRHIVEHNSTTFLQNLICTQNWPRLIDNVKSELDNKITLSATDFTL